MVARWAFNGPMVRAKACPILARRLSRHGLGDARHGLAICRNSGCPGQAHDRCSRAKNCRRPATFAHQFVPVHELQTLQHLEMAVDGRLLAPHGSGQRRRRHRTVGGQAIDNVMADWTCDGRELVRSGNPVDLPAGHDRVVTDPPRKCSSIWL